MFRPALLAAVLCAPCTPQLLPDEVLVVTRLSGTPASGLLAVDLPRGVLTPLGRFPSDGQPPLAMQIDPASGDAVLAVDLGSTSRVLRLELQGSRVVRERVLGDVPGTVTDLAFGGRDEVVLTAGGPAGGVYAVPRGGGAARLLAPLPRATAITPRGHPTTELLVVQSGAAPGSDPARLRLDPFTGQASPGRIPMQGYRPFGITGLYELGNAVGHNVFANDDGSIAVGFHGQAPQVLSLSPALPAGATTRVRGGLHSGYPPTVLGGRAHPYLKQFASFCPSHAQQWSNVFGPLPGDPVDFDAMPGGRARVVVFGEVCGGAGGMALFPHGLPTLGNAGFRIRGSGAVPNAPAHLAVGVSDERFGPFALPLALGACRLLVSAEVVASTTADASGFLSQFLPIPNAPALAGTAFYTQWVQLAGTVDTSDGGAVFVGN